MRLKPMKSENSHDDTRTDALPRAGPYPLRMKLKPFAAVIAISLAVTACGLRGSTSTFLEAGDMQIGQSCSNELQDNAFLRLSTNIAIEGSWYKMTALSDPGDRFPFPESGFPVYEIEATTEAVASAPDRTSFLLEPGMAEAVSSGINESEDSDVLVRADSSGFIDFGFRFRTNDIAVPFVPCPVYERQQQALNDYLDHVAADSTEQRSAEILRMANADGNSPEAIGDFREFIAEQGIFD